MEPEPLAQTHFEELDNHMDLTLPGHTHGGRTMLFGRFRMVPPDDGTERACGLYQTDGRALIVSGAVVYPKVPLRGNMPPERNPITLS